MSVKHILKSLKTFPNQKFESPSPCMHFSSKKVKPNAYTASNMALQIVDKKHQI